MSDQTTQLNVTDSVPAPRDEAGGADDVGGAGGAGAVVDVAEIVLEPDDVVQTSDLSSEEARARTDALRQDLRRSLREIDDLYRRRVWVALGYANWQEYWASEFADTRPPQLSRDERRSAIAELTDRQLPSTVIATVFNLNPTTVQRDRNALLEAEDRAAADRGEEPQARHVVTGAGRTRPARNQRARKPESSGEKPFGVAFETAMLDLAGAVDRVMGLHTDPRFRSYLPQLRAEHGRQVDQVMTAIGELYDSLVLPEN